MTDVELAQGCARGDRQAQRLLYERYSDRIYRVLSRMSPNNDEALDLAQETFVRVFQKIHMFDGASGLMTWIYRIAINEVLQSRRREKRLQKTMERLAQQRRQDGVDSPDERRRDLLEALALLPGAERALLVLRYIEGLSYEEMAKVLGKPAGTIGSGLNRARTMLRQVLSCDGMKKSKGTRIKRDGGEYNPLPEVPTTPAGQRMAEGRNG